MATLSAAVLAACGSDVMASGHVIVEPEPPPARVAFLVQGVELFYGLAVYTCKGERPMWVLADRTDSVAPPTRIVYGTNPEGFIVREGPRPLRPGCYVVTISGPRSARFTVRPDGSVAVADTVRRPAAPDSR